MLLLYNRPASSLLSQPSPSSDGQGSNLPRLWSRLRSADMVHRISQRRHPAPMWPASSTFQSRFSSPMVSPQEDRHSQQARLEGSFLVDTALRSSEMHFQYTPSCSQGTSREGSCYQHTESCTQTSLH